MSETSNNVVNMAEYKARKEVAEFNFPQAPQLGAETWQDTIEATPAPSVEPVVESHDGRPHVRTVSGRQITFNPQEKDYNPINKGELAPESEAIFKVALDLMKAREAVTDILTEPVSIVSNDAYVADVLSQQEKAAA